MNAVKGLKKICCTLFLVTGLLVTLASVAQGQGIESIKCDFNSVKPYSADMEGPYEYVGETHRVTALEEACGSARLQCLQDGNDTCKQAGVSGGIRESALSKIPVLMIFAPPTSPYDDSYAECTYYGYRKVVRKRSQKVMDEAKCFLANQCYQDYFNYFPKDEREERARTTRMQEIIEFKNTTCN